MSSYVIRTDDNATMVTKSKVGAYAWLICAIGAIFYSYEYFLRITPSVMTSQLMYHYQIDAGTFGLVSAFYYYAYVPMQLPVGVLLDRFGPRRLLTIACSICVIGTYLLAGTHSLAAAAAGRFFIGFGSAFAFVGVLKLATIWLPSDKLALVAGITAALGTVGGMIGDVSLTSLVTKVGWEETLIITAMIGFIITALIWFIVRDGKKSAIETPVSPPKTNGFRQGLIELGLIARNPQIWLTGLYGCFVYLPTTVLAELWGIPYLEHAYYYSPDKAGWGVFALFLGFTIGAPSIGWISDHLHNRKKPMMVGALLAACASAIVIYVPGLSYHAVLLTLFILGICYGGQSLVFAVGREISPKHAAGTAMAFVNMIVMMGAFAVQPFVGELLDWHNKSTSIVHPIYSASDYQFALAIIPVGILIAAILVLFIKETHAKPVQY